MFQPRFHEIIALGRKRQTVRPTRKNLILPGENLSLRAWIGKPYRSKQRILRTVTCEDTTECRIDSVTKTVFAWGRPIADLDYFAVQDGFENASDLFEWFATAHGHSLFVGTLITW